MRRSGTSSNKFFGRSPVTAILGTSLLVVAMALPAGATPIQPTAEQLLRQTEQPVMPYIPAQVGWQDVAAERQDAGEVTGSGLAGFNTTEILRDTEAARNRRAILLSIARPDPRVMLAFGAIILLLRLLRRMRTLRKGAGVPAPVQAASS